MTTSDAETVKQALDGCDRLVGRACSWLRTDAARTRNEAARVAAEREQALERRSDDRAWRRVTAYAVPVPFVRSALLRRFDRDIEERSGAIDALARQAEGLVAQADAGERAARRVAKVGEHVGRARLAWRELGGVPLPIAAKATNCARRVTTLSSGKRSRAWAAAVSKLGEDCVSMVREWAALTEEARARRAAESTRTAAVSRPLGKGADQARIYLPVPIETARKAIRLGAGSDEGSQPGQSRAFVTRGMDLAPFRSMLPLALRAKPPGFEFPPIHFKAASQNLWGLFDRQTWDHVKQSCCAMTGRRCVVCGKSGGWFASKVFDKDENRAGVDCHEVWEWSMPDQRSGIGVQRLKRILVVCPDCHMMFHEGYARNRARDVGLDAEATDFVRRRRMTVNQVDEATLAKGIEGTTGHLKAMLSGVDKWVVDLSHLGAQQYMADRVPVMSETNAASVPPDRIAGLDFETDKGRTFGARDAATVQRALIDADDGLGYNVVSISSRR